MKIKKNHPLAKQGLVVGQQVTHCGISYNVIDEDFREYEIEPQRLCAWKKNSKIY